MKKSVKVVAILLSLLIVFTYSGCANKAVDSTEGSIGSNTPSEASTSEGDAEIQAAFDEFLERQFKEEATIDSITLNFSLRHPENYGIERMEPTYGDYSAEAFTENDEKNKKAWEELNSFEYSALTADQQLTYDVFKYKMETSLKFEGFDHYGNVLSPTIGLQAQLPFILAEYHFYSEQDVEDYLILLSKMDEYYQDIIIFEQEKSEKGFFMSDDAVDAVIKSCNEFLSNKEENFLIESFDSRVDEMDIADDKKEKYKEDNKNAVLEGVIPAYNNLITGLEKLKGTGNNEGGVCNFERGKEYYELLTRNNTGSAKSVTEIAKALDDNTQMALYAIYQTVQEYPEVTDYLSQPGYNSDNPEDIMEYLKEQMAFRYPQSAEVNYTLKYIDPSMEESSSPAFYLIPPLDDFSSNVIYINGSKATADALYGTMAHEGFPGHLYQSTYYFSQNPNPIRYSLGFGGYTEGWASYVETNAFFYADYPEMPNEVSDILRADRIASLFIHARVDIGVNYDGWSVEELNEYLDSFGMGDLEASKDFHRRVVQEPANYLKYAVGLLEFLELYSYAVNELGNDFSLMEYHKSVLDVGPAPFSIVKDAVDNYINSY